MEIKVLHSGDESVLEEGRRHGCSEAWVLTDRGNQAAMRLYAGRGGKETDQVMFSFVLSAVQS